MEILHRLDKALTAYLTGGDTGSDPRMRRLGIAWRMLPADQRELLVLHYRDPRPVCQKAKAVGLSRPVFYECATRAKCTLLGIMSGLAADRDRAA